MQNYFKQWSITVLLLTLIACSKNNPCLINSTVAPRIAFKTIDDSLRERDSILLNPAIVLENITYIGFKTNAISFPIPSNVQAVDYLFIADTATAIVDTIHIEYTKSLNYISKECGFNYFYQLTNATCTKVALKNIFIIDSIINNNAQKVNFKIIL